MSDVPPMDDLSWQLPAVSTAHAREFNRQAWLSYQTTNYVQTASFARQALEAAREEGDGVMEAEALSHLGHVSAGLGDYLSALDFQQRSVSILRGLGHLAGLARPLAGLANLHGALGNHEEQRQVFEEALEIARQIGDPPGVASALIGLGAAWFHAGDLTHARRWIDDGLRAAEAIDFTTLQVVGLDYQGQIHAALGDPIGAEVTHQEALAVARRSGNRKGEARQRQRLGDLLVGRGALEEGVAQLQRALEEASTLGLPRLVEESHASLASALQLAGDHAGALLHLQRQLTLERARLSGEARQRVAILAAQTREAWSLREAERQRQEAERLARLVHHDPLTGLANRAGLTRALEAQAAACAPFAVLFIDLDGFKAVNDSLGHAAGDALLIGVAARLQGALQPSEVLARLGGDEFCVLLPQVGAATAARQRAEALRAQLSAPFVVWGRTLNVTASVGVSVGQGDGPALLREADLAMYAAKRQGKNAVRPFHRAMHGAAHERLLVEQRLRSVLEREELTLHVQPQIELATGQPRGVEALLRWTPPGQPPVSPAVFIPAAEDLGLIVPIGAWVLDQACALLAARPDLPLIAVNVSPLQVADPDFLTTVTAALARHEVDPRRLELEVTERIVIADPAATEVLFNRLRALGIRLALDDFGAGVASLHQLLNLPFNTLKLDRSLIQSLDTRPSATRVLGALRALSHDLDLTVIAEGIETEAQLQAVRALGCDAGQGYLLGRPGPPGDVQVLTTGRRRR